jgi:hypothetical protein
MDVDMDMDIDMDMDKKNKINSNSNSNSNSNVSIAILAQAILVLGVTKGIAFPAIHPMGRSTFECPCGRPAVDFGGSADVCDKCC